MKTLIINNHTKHLRELASLFPDVSILNKESLTNKLDTTSYDLLVFSGGSDVPTVLRHSDEYIFEINLIKKSKLPILGICLGAEIICSAYGGELLELTEKQRGIFHIKVEDNELELQLGTDQLEVIEGHKISVKNLPLNFVSCASSQQGIEIFKHKQRPIIGFQFHPEMLNNNKLLNWMFKTLDITK